MGCPRFSALVTATTLSMACAVGHKPPPAPQAAVRGSSRAAPAAVRSPMSLPTAGGDVAAELGFVTVPENRDDPDSRDIEVAFVRLPTTSEHPGPPIVYLEGGPGIPGTLSVQLPVWQMLAALRKQADVIVVDQRGTGLSKPSLSCPVVEAPPHALADDDRLVDSVLQASRACRDAMRERKIDLAGYDTVQSAADIDAVVGALGVPQVDLVGFSYGTHLGLTVIRNHRPHVRRAVLMGVAGPDHLRKRPADVDAQLARIAALAAADPCVAAEVPDLLALMRRVHARAAEQPFVITITDPRTGRPAQTSVGALAIQVLVFADMGDSRDLVWFPALYHELSHGHVERLARLVQRRFLGGGTMSAMSVVMRLASGASPRRAAAIQDELPGAILGRAIDFPFNEPAFHKVWAIPELDASHRSPLRTDVPTLFISGTLDGNAPPARTAPLLAGFQRGSHLLVEHAGHEDYFVDDAVVERIVEFVRTGATSVQTISRPAPQFEPVGTCVR